jgi:hypothetical protein
MYGLKPVPTSPYLPYPVLGKEFSPQPVKPYPSYSEFRSSVMERFDGMVAQVTNET